MSGATGQSIPGADVISRRFSLTRYFFQPANSAFSASVASNSFSYCPVYGNNQSATVAHRGHCHAGLGKCASGSFRQCIVARLPVHTWFGEAGINHLFSRFGDACASSRAPRYRCFPGWRLSKPHSCISFLANQRPTAIE